MITFLKRTKKIKLQKKFEEKFVDIENGQDIALHLSNVGQNQNDIQIKQVFDYYKLWDKLQNGEKIEL